jgi:hypothetical protein
MRIAALSALFFYFPKQEFLIGRSSVPFVYLWCSFHFVVNLFVNFQDMLQKILNNKLTFVQFLFLVVLLVLVRAFENQLFYDPFLIFSKKILRCYVAILIQHNYFRLFSLSGVKNAQRH